MFELFKIFYKEKPLILPVKKQVISWQKANRKMRWGIQKAEFGKIIEPGQLRKKAKENTGCGPEGIQLLTITHPNLARLMNQRKLSFMIFADYDVAPHGFYDFYDAV